MDNDRLLKIIGEFETECVNLATGSGSYEKYEFQRNKIIAETELKSAIPDWILQARFGNYFRDHMKLISDQYKGRREYLKKEFSKIYDFVQTGGGSPMSVSFNEIQNLIKGGTVEGLWLKVHQRRENDPEGAITAARSIFESVLKYILDELKVEYEQREDIDDLYKKVSKNLSLSPEDHTEQVFKQILQGVKSVVMGFSTLRNKYGDAHGKGRQYSPPERRHADLVINLTASICTFLLETHQNKTSQPKTIRR